MRKVIWSAALALLLGAQAKADPIPSVPANYIMNTAAQQNAQINIGTATIRGKLTVSTVVISNLSVSSITAAQFFGGGAGITNLDASQLTVVSTVPAARLTGAYPGVTGVGTVSSGVWHGSPIGTQYGGTGQNLVATPQGYLPYFSATGVVSTLAPGTAGNILQTNGSSANPAWTGAPQILGTNVTSIPLVNLQSGNLPQTIAVNDASISTVSASKVLGNISGYAANITGTLSQAQLAIGTLSNSIPASSITVTGVTPGTYGGPSYMTQFNVRSDGRLSSANQFNLVVYTTAVAPGTFPAQVYLPAGQVSGPGYLPNNVIASSINVNGVAAGTYGGPTISAQITVGSDGRVTNVAQFALAGISTTTAFVDVDNNWRHAQTSISSWTFKSPSFSVGGSTLVISNGLVGIGTASPGTLLDVNGAVNIRSTATVQGNGFSVHGTDLEVFNGGGGIVGIGGPPTIVPLKVYGAIELNSELRFTPTNTSDIGQNSATSPRSVYVGTSFIPPLGSASTPPYSFLNHADTGLYQVGPGTVAFTTEGVQRMTIGSSTMNISVPVSANSGVFVPAGKQVLVGSNGACGSTPGLCVDELTSGNVAFLRNANGAQLRLLNGTPPDVGIYMATQDGSATNNSLNINNSGTHLFTVANDGKVGVGVLGNAATLLDVTGNAQFGSGALKSTMTATGEGVFPSSVTASAFFGDGSHLTGTGSTINGLTMEGAQSNTALRSLSCAVLPCQANSTTDYDIYTATGTGPGQWRNARLGTGP